MSNVEQLRQPDRDEDERCRGGWFWDGERWACDWDRDRDRDRPPWHGRPPGCPPWYGPERPPWYPGANGGITFSHRPPRHVIRGHLWWNGRVLSLFDGVVWVPLLPNTQTKDVPITHDYLVFHTDTAFSGTAGVWQSQVAAFAIIPPGDWDVTGSCIWQFPCRGGQMSVVNEPPGQLMPWLGQWQTESIMDLMTLTSPAIGFRVTVPTLIPVTLQTLGSGTPGNTSFCISARRMDASISVEQTIPWPPVPDEDGCEEC